MLALSTSVRKKYENIVDSQSITTKINNNKIMFYVKLLIVLNDKKKNCFK